MTDFSLLSARVAGPVLTPADPGFAEEVSGFNITFTNTPQVAVGVSSVDDVIEAVKFAAANGLHISVLATGHGLHGAIESGMVINTQRLDTVSVDADSSIATIAAGVRWAQVLEAGAPFGLAPIAGSSTNVGVVGYILGGGLGPLARSHGFSSDYLVSVDIVLPSGELVTADAGNNTDLYWALRGGKGGFGVVTSVRVTLVDLPTLYAGSLTFAAHDIEKAYRGWIDYTKVARPDVTTSSVIMHFPDIEQLPPHLRGQTMLTIRFAFPGDAAIGEQIATPLRALATPIVDALAEMPSTAMATIHNDPSDPSPSWGHGALLNNLDQDFATALLEHVGADKQTPLLAVEVRHIGSATTRDVPGGSAVGGRNSGYTLHIIGAPNPALFAEVIPGAAAALESSIASWISPELTVNFWDGDAAEFATAWPTATFDRLEDLRHQVDPDGIVAYGPHRG